MSTLLAVDPSLRGTGWAYFERGMLEKCGVLEGSTDTTRIEAVRAIHASINVSGKYPELVIEFPRIYPKGRGETDHVDPNDLLWVAAVAGAMSTLGPSKIYYPSDWKGQSKKEKTLRLVLQACTPAERAVIEQVKGWKRHNAVDAVGIGMYHLKRIGKNLVQETFV